MTMRAQWLLQDGDDMPESPALSNWRAKAEDFRRRFWEYQKTRPSNRWAMEADGLLAVALVEIAELQRKDKT